MLFVVVLLCLSLPQVSASCEEQCRCPAEAPRCTPGVGLVLDGCGCCQVCAQQLFEDCSKMRPCDRAKGLECNFGGGSDSTRGVCRAKSDGRTCEYNNKIYQNGETFRPNCKHQCTCMDGAVGCVSLCPHQLALAKPRCAKPRLLKVAGQCCERTVCPGDAQTKDHGRHKDHDLENELAFPWRGEAGFRGQPVGQVPSRKCVPQTTEWSPCSRSCGAGVSTRMSNTNSRCKAVKETRICEIRPCKQLDPAKLKNGQKCSRLEKAGRPVRLSHAGCRSLKRFQPRFCGACGDGRCCRPHRTQTLPVRFRCQNGDTFSKMVMMIQSCKCKPDCGKPPAHQLFNDVYKLNV